MRRLTACAIIAATACSLTTSLHDLSGGSIMDAASEVVSASNDASHDPYPKPDDASADATDRDAFACWRLSPQPFHCEDFDEGDDTAALGATVLDNGGVVAADTTSFLSPPRAVRLSVPAQAGAGSVARARLDRALVSPNPP